MTDLSVLDGEKNKSAFGLLQKGLFALGEVDFADEPLPRVLQVLGLNLGDLLVDGLSCLGLGSVEFGILGGVGGSLQLGVQIGRGSLRSGREIDAGKAVRKRLAGGFEVGRHRDCVCR